MEWFKLAPSIFCLLLRSVTVRPTLCVNHWPCCRRGMSFSFPYPILNRVQNRVIFAFLFYYSVQGFEINREILYLRRIASSRGRSPLLSISFVWHHLFGHLRTILSFTFTFSFKSWSLPLNVESPCQLRKYYLKSMRNLYHSVSTLLTWHVVHGMQPWFLH